MEKDKNIRIVGHKRNTQIVINQFHLYWFEKWFYRPVIHSVTYEEDGIEVHLFISPNRVLRKHISYDIFSSRGGKWGR